MLDQLLDLLTDSKKFPNLKDLVLVGHSGGGQMVQRYALAGKFSPSSRLTVRYVVCAPGAYAYLTPERLVPGSKSEFDEPSKDQQRKAPAYNEWGYGLDEAYKYSTGTNWRFVIRDYGKKNIFYVCGENDNESEGKDVPTTPVAKLQGAHRLERMKILFSYLYCRALGFVIREELEIEAH